MSFHARSITCPNVEYKVFFLCFCFCNDDLFFACVIFPTHLLQMWDILRLFLYFWCALSKIWYAMEFFTFFHDKFVSNRRGYTIQCYKRGKDILNKNCSQSYSTISKILLVPTPTDSFIDSYIVWKDHLSKNDRNLEYFGSLTTWNC